MGKSNPRAPRRPPLRRWRVQLSAHTVAGRYPVTPASVTLPAPSAEVAIEFAITEAHRRGCVPPWRPCRTESRPHATAREVVL